MSRASLAFFVVLLLTGCASTETAIDRSNLQISDNSRIVARNMLPTAVPAFQRVAEHLGLAQEVYQKQLSLLKDRRDELRSRGRLLDASSYATFALTTVAIGATSIAIRKDADAPNALRNAGFGALGGLALGTLLKVFGYMQEEPASIDRKIKQLQGSYDGMLERLRLLAVGIQKEGANADAIAAEMASAIESFMSEALQIDIKG